MKRETQKAKLEDEIKRLAELAKSSFGRDLDFLDDLPDPPRRVEIPFPYGSSEARPYGWFCK